MALDTHQSHAVAFQRTFEYIRNTVRSKSEVIINGDNLDIAQLVAVVRDGCTATLAKDPQTVNRIQASINVLEQCLSGGHTIYGVNTGFGGSADVRTLQHNTLQMSLPKFLNNGILVPADSKRDSHDSSLHELRSHSLPSQVVKATMLIRCNSLMRGHSGVRLQVIETMMTMLKHDLIPIIPLRGSISASGDLAPLSYIVRAIQGCPEIRVECGKTKTVLPADEALRLAGLSPVVLGPKEGLGLLNGTATSCAYASLALHQSQQLALLTQITTAMCTEALLGHASNFDPFIAKIRPHRGQIESASNIFNFLSGSRLCTESGNHVVGLAQDRYALRTASQWIGPQLEDLMLAETQVAVELNSTTDNPLIDASTGIIHHGGNFQAVSVTSAMEKTRLAVQMLGKLIFAQSQELVNPVFNKGLPPNLTAEEPSLCFTFKGADLAMAAYISELGFLANPVSSHVHSAEMHNQAVNSLALISARYTMEAVEVLSMMCATYLFELCQALDLRVVAIEFQKLVKPVFTELTAALIFGSEYTLQIETLWIKLWSEWDRHSCLDLQVRAAETANNAKFALLDVLSASTSNPPADILYQVNTYQKKLATTLETTYLSVQESTERDSSTTKQYLGTASRAMYTYVRETLALPMQKDLQGPGFELVESRHHFKSGGAAESKYFGTSVGTKISVIYEELRNGGMAEAVVKCFHQEVKAKL